MGQGSEFVATTDIRRFLRALRPAALLGGFVVLWWLLATGAAHAEAGPQNDAGASTRVLAGAVDRVVHQPVARVAEPVRQRSSVPANAVRTVRQHATPALSTTRAIVENNPVEPIVSRAAATVRPEVTKAVEQAREVLEAAPAGGVVIPELEDPTEAVSSLPVVGESSTLQGETPSKCTTLTGGAAPAAFLDSASEKALVGQHQAAPSAPLGAGFDGPALRSSGTTAAASSGQSPSGSGVGAGACEAGLTITLPATRTQLPSQADRQPAGQAYAPSSTPD